MDFFQYLKNIFFDSRNTLRDGGSITLKTACTLFTTFILFTLITLFNCLHFVSSVSMYPYVFFSNNDGNKRHLLCSILVLAAPVGTQWYQEAINSCSYVLNTKFTHTKNWHDIYSFHSVSLYQIVLNVSCFVNIMLSRKFTTFFSPVERCCILNLSLINDTSSFFSTHQYCCDERNATKNTCTQMSLLDQFWASVLWNLAFRNADQSQ